MSLVDPNDRTAQELQFFFQELEDNCYTRAHLTIQGAKTCVINLQREKNLVLWNNDLQAKKSFTRQFYNWLTDGDQVACILRSHTSWRELTSRAITTEVRGYVLKIQADRLLVAKIDKNELQYAFEINSLTGEKVKLDYSDLIYLD